MRRYLFVGPSLPDATRLAEDTDIHVAPPVAGGNLLRLTAASGDVVGIVDGYFHQTHAVRHKEILALLGRGVRVLGAASIGALRAAELDRFGMEGIGEIYRNYRDGVLEADDEVALLHGPADSGYRPMPEPLVNLRATLDRAEAAGLIDTAVHSRLIAALRQLPFGQRSYRALTGIAHQAGMAQQAIASLDRFCAEYPVERKRQDALELFETLRTARPKPPARPPHVAHTALLEAWELGATTRIVGTGTVPDLMILRICQLFARDFPALYRAMVLRRLADECAELCGPPAAVELTDIAVERGVHRGFYPAVRDKADFGFLRPWLSDAEDRTCELRERLVAFLVRSFRIAPGILDERGMLHALRDLPGLATIRALAEAADRVNAQAGQQLARFDPMSISTERIVDWFTGHWSTSSAALPLAALDRGVESVPMMVTVARPFYLLARYNPERVDFRLVPTSGVMVD